MLPVAAVALAFGLQGALLEYGRLFRAEFGALADLRFLDNYHQLYAQLEAMVENSPYPSGGQNFAEIARHYIALIYLVGLLEEWLTVLFPPFLVALLAGIRHPPNRSSALILWSVGGYLLLIYYSHLSRDFIQSRFLFAPALLLYPWVGRGMERIWARLRRAPRARWLGALFAGFFFLPALVDTGAMIARRDPSLAAAGRWVQAQPEFDAARMFFNDGRVAYHAGQSRQEFDRNLGLWRGEGLPGEDFARLHGFDLVALLLRSGEEGQGRHLFPSFVRRKAFEGRRYLVEIYAAPGVGAPDGAAAHGPPATP